MSWFSGLCKAGYLLKRLAMKARFNLGFPRTTSVAVTNCRQPSLSACCSMHSALWMSSFSCNEKGVKRLGQGSIHIRACIPWRGSRVSLMRQVQTQADPYDIYHMHVSHEVTGSVTETKGPSSFNKFKGNCRKIWHPVHGPKLFSVAKLPFGVAFCTDFMRICSIESLLSNNLCFCF